MPKILEKRHLIFLGLAVLVLGAGAFYYSNAREAVPGIPVDKMAEPSPQATQEEVNTDLRNRLENVKHENLCKKYGGVWNPCASACPDAGPDEMCIQVCVEKCEAPITKEILPIFFTINALSSRSEPECDEVYPLPTEVTLGDSSLSLPEIAMHTLLEGPSEKGGELATTNIPEGVELLRLEILDRVAIVDFSAELNTAAGSCRVAAIRAQIEKTLTRFAHIDEVIITVEGNSEEALQP